MVNCSVLLTLGLWSQLKAKRKYSYSDPMHIPNQLLELDMISMVLSGKALSSPVCSKWFRRPLKWALSNFMPFVYQGVTRLRRTNLPILQLWNQQNYFSLKWEIHCCWEFVSQLQKIKHSICFGYRSDPNWNRKSTDRNLSGSISEFFESKVAEYSNPKILVDSFL